MEAKGMEWKEKRVNKREGKEWKGYEVKGKEGKGQ